MHNYNLFEEKGKHLTKGCMKTKVNIMLCFLLYNYMYFEEMLQECIQKNGGFIFGS